MKSQNPDSIASIVVIRNNEEVGLVGSFLKALQQKLCPKVPPKFEEETKPSNSWVITGHHDGEIKRLTTLEGRMFLSTR